MTLGDVMTRSVVTVHMDDPLDRIRSIFQESRFHHLLVTDNGKLVGVISDRDLLKNVSPFIGNDMMERRQDTNTLQRRAHQIMTRYPVTATIDTPVEDGVRLLMQQRVSCLPITNSTQHIEGIVSWRDLLRGLVDVTDRADAA